jgi:hypothetical protein
MTQLYFVCIAAGKLKTLQYVVFIVVLLQSTFIISTSGVVTRPLVVLSKR